MELTRKHLSRFLAHKLKVLHFGDKKVLNTGDGSSNNWIGLSAAVKYQDSQKLKPILRSLVFIISEIEHNGKKIIPIVELAAMAMKGMENLAVDRIYIDNMTAVLRFKAHDGSALCFEVDLDHPDQGGVCFDIVREYDEENKLDVFTPPNNQLAMFDNMAEYHFDFEYLIAAGLAEEKRD